jgi:hypothetical protein
MAIEQRLVQNKKSLVRQWFDMLAGTYPLETVRLLKKETSQFANPVGQTFLVAIGEILDEFLGQNSAEAMALLLDKVIRIRAIQDFSPSSSLAFIFGLKTIAREVLEEDLTAGVVSREELSDFDLKVDGLALCAFDVYMRCRENLFEVRMTEVKNRTHRLLKRAEIIAEPGEGSE